MANHDVTSGQSWAAIAEALPAPGGSGRRAGRRGPAPLPDAAAPRAAPHVDAAPALRQGGALAARV